ncbi:hypothetical protein EX895_003634 [Sporisorium graminicola]|uniref:ER transporter 6TM N-terminal domain-containing protein n=1 Tax=Sporisorium graminicola TaxID=280036 RepID=A0A4U7KSG9_9BASI|nr:hypothetical protein EX895_003634 [Sporisorium graminicola]TKY86957.1 hypothetical protein EX895_003634 [Sporisorium graminicola]
MSTTPANHPSAQPAAPAAQAPTETWSSSARETSQNGGVAAPPKEKRDQQTAKAKKSSKLPSWIKDNLTSARSWRIVARCWVATWANFVLMIPGPSLRVLGQAAFFGCMVTLMIPPCYPFFLFFIAFSLLAIGALVGWAWGCAAAAAASRARSVEVLQAATQRVRSSAASSTNPEAYVALAVFKGEFLDVRSTAVFGVFLMLACYFVAVLQVKLPKLKIGSIFVLILVDIMATYGPLFPYARYTLGEIFMIPVGCSLAICLASQIFIFPETLAHAWQLGFVDMLGTNRDLIRMHESALADVSQLYDPLTHLDPHARGVQPSSDLLRRHRQAEDDAAKIATSLLADVKANRSALSEQNENLDGQITFLGMEFYRSYVSSHAMKSAFRKTRTVSLQLTLLNSFWRLIAREFGLADPNTYDENWDPTKAEQGYLIDGEHGTYAQPTKDRLEPIRLHETHTIHRARRDLFTSEAAQQVPMSRMLNILKGVATPSLDAAGNSIQALQDYFDANLSWRRKQPIDQVIHQLHETKTRLESARQGLFNDKRLELLQPYADHFRVLHPDLDLKEHFLQTKGSIQSFRAGGRPLHVCLVYVTTLLDALDSILRLHEEVLNAADRAGSKKRIWAPKHLGRLFAILSSDKHGSADGLDRFGSGDGQFEREEAIDGEYREDRAGSSSSSNSSSSNLSGHFDGESDLDSDDGETRAATSRSSRPTDEEKNTGSSVSSKKAKRERKQRFYARDPDALPPTNIGHRIGRGVAATYYFVTGPTGLYALRMCVATFAVWITAVLPHTADFVYQHRGLWALIMAQTAFALSGGELIATFVMRIAGTVAGLLYGAALWYVSTGNGRGNAYGIAATTAVGFVPLVFVRVWAPKMLLLPSIMMNVSFVLIMGYSWIDTHLQVVANSGVGIGLAWKRALLVIIGMTVALIVMVFPRPVSSRSLLRKNMAKVTRQLNDLFADVMEAWIARNRIHAQETERSGFANQVAVDEEGAGSSSEAIDKLWHEREPVIRARFMAIAVAIASYPMQIGLATMDFHIRGRWPSERYVEIAAIHATILESLGAIVSSVRAFDQLPTPAEGDAIKRVTASSETRMSQNDWQVLLSSSTSLLDPQHLAEICTMFDLLSKALKNGERLNHASFLLLENHFKYAHRNGNIERFLRKRAAVERGESEQNTTDGEDVLSWGVLLDPMYLRYTTARMASLTLVAQLDKFKAIVQDLVGESSLRGFDMLKEQYDERSYRVAAAINNL